MTDLYLNSKNIKLFPSAYRGKNETKLFNPESRLFSEKNITGINNGITDTNSYVVGTSSNDDIALAGSVLYFVLAGYRFEVTITSDLLTSFATDSNTNVYAYIALKKKNSTEDTDNITFDGLSIVDWDITGYPSGEPLDLLNDEATPYYNFKGLLLSSSASLTNTGADAVKKLLILTKSGSNWIVPTASKLRISTNSIYLPGTTTNITSKLSAATTTSIGLMSATDKAKLDGIAEATQSKAGLMSAADKTKLDNLVNATTATAGLMSAADKTKLDAIITSVPIYVQGTEPTTTGLTVAIWVNTANENEVKIYASGAWAGISATYY